MLSLWINLIITVKILPQKKKMGDKGSYICDMLKEIEKELNIN